MMGRAAGVMMGSTGEIMSKGVGSFEKKIWIPDPRGGAVGSVGFLRIFFLNKKKFYTCELNFFKREITMIWDWAKTIVCFVHFWGLNNIATE